jgi:hypothetical protein
MARRAENDHVSLQAGWPAGVRIIAAPFDHEPPTLPYVFAAAFPPVSDAPLRRLALACRLLADAGRLDREGALAARLELCAVLADTFPADAPIVDVLRTVEAERAWAGLERERYRERRRDLAQLDDAQLARYARVTEAVPRFAVHALALLTADERARDPLIEAAGDCAEAVQLLSDVRGWRADLAAHRPTFATARLARASGSSNANGAAPDAAAALYLGGIAAELVARAAALAARAQDTLAACGGVRWRRADEAVAEAGRIGAALAAARGLTSSE